MISNSFSFSNSFNYSQFQSSATENFSRADTDNNGALTKEEILANNDNIKSPEKFEKIFDRMDADGDGLLSKAEHQEAVNHVADRIQSMSDQMTNTNPSIDNLRYLLELRANSNSGV